MICLVQLDDLLAEIHFEVEVDLHLKDFEVMRICLVDEVHLDEDHLLLIWKIYLVVECEEVDFEDNKVQDNRLKRKNQKV
jgi:hypothetical protein